jgi:hypothetical protein
MTDAQPADIRDIFPGWFEDGADRRAYFEGALIVLDANILLALYRISPKARQQLLSVLGRIRDRLWVPHQAALEFARNRSKVIVDRNSRFSDVKRSLRTACDKAAAELYAAVDDLKGLRSSVVAHGDWDESHHGLTQDEIKLRMQALMRPALDEYARLNADQDLSFQDVRDQGDPVMRDLCPLLQGRVGPKYPTSKLQSIIDDAISFRFPNEIPPGYLDLKTKPPARAAGDFVLWTQLIDKSRLVSNERDMVVLVTIDVKPDWWQLDRNHKPVAARPELVQEIYDEAGAKLLLLTLDQFLEGSRTYLAEDVSPETVEEARDVVSEERPSPDLLSVLDGRSLQDLDHGELLEFVGNLFRSFGQETIDAFPVPNVDLILEGNDKRTAVQVIQTNLVTSRDVLRLIPSVRVPAADRGAIVTAGTFSDAAKLAAKKADPQIALMDGDYLRHLADTLRSNTSDAGTG